MRQYTEQDADAAANGYVVYLRKSRQDIEAEKSGEMETLARHAKILNSVAEEQGLNVVKVYKELVSGETIRDRPEMTQMMKEVYAGKYKGVIVVKPDRLSRGDLENMGYIMNGLKFSGTLLVTPGKTYDVLNNKFDEQMLEMQLFNSKQEYRAIVARMQEGKMLSVRDGNYMGSLPPYGYDIISPDRWTRTLRPNADAEIVVKIFDWFVKDRLNPGEISRKLYAMGVPTLTGNPEWHRATIKDILKNNLYTGKIRWYRRKTTRELDENGAISKKKRRHESKGYLIVQGKHPAIISDEIFNEAQTLFTGAVPTRTGAVVVNPLAGLLKCKECGKTMCYQGYNNRSTTLPRFVHAESKNHQAKSCEVSVVMDLLCASLKAYIDDFEFKVSNAGRMAEMEKHSAEVERLERELEKAKIKRRRLFDDYDDGVYTAAEFKERKAVWADRIERITYELDDLQRQKPEEIDYKEKAIRFTQVLEAVQDPNETAKRKNEILKEILERIDYSCVDLGRQKGGVVTLDLILKD